MTQIARRTPSSRAPPLPVPPKAKSFLVLFFKKEPLPVSLNISSRNQPALPPLTLPSRQMQDISMTKAIGYAAQHSYSRLRKLEFDRPDPRPHEVDIEVLFCGVCHSDIHQVKNEWSNTVYPCMPGHEIVGRVTRIGAAVTRHDVGDLVGVGCMIDSCRHCEACAAHEENYCEGPNSWLATYNGPMVAKAMSPTGENQYGRDNTYGGYSTSVVVAEDFVLKVPSALKPEVAAPILCAGVTTYSPMKHWGVKPGDHVGVIGFGGLGDMAAKIARAMGARVTIFTRSPDKLADGARLGAEAVLASDKAALQRLRNSFDFMISTIPEKHDVNPFVALLKRDCTLAVVGAIEPLAAENNQERVMHRKSVAGSLIGSIADTQEILDFCAAHGIGPDIEIIPIQEINDAYKRVENGEVRYRYVIDMD
jgi:uncharacterized zinc-type alcohol dehydrogenase-like protein